MSNVFENVSAQFLSQEASLLQPIISWILLDNDYSLSKLPFVQQDITDWKLRNVFKAIVETYDEGYWRDLTQIVKKAKEYWVEQKEVLELMSGWVTSISLNPNYITRYKEFLSKKRVLKISNDLMLKACSTLSTGDILKSTNDLIETISESNSSYSIGDNVENLLTYIDDRKWKDLFGYSFWEEFSFLDKATRWIQAGRTYRIGAPSNMGKTQMIYWIINNLISQWAKVAFFSLENDKDMTLSNLLANRQKINSWDLESWKKDVDMQKLGEMDWKLFVIDDTHEISEIFSKVLAIKPDVVILDYIGLITINKYWESELFTEYAKRVQQFVKKTRVGWIDLSNLPIGVDDDEIIARGQFYGSSYLRNNADVGIHLLKYKEFYEYKTSVEATPEHRNRLQNDSSYRMNWISKKGIKVAITKNRIWPAGLEEPYIVNFAQWGRFAALTEAQKAIFTLD